MPTDPSATILCCLVPQKGQAHSGLRAFAGVALLALGSLLYLPAHHALQGAFVDYQSKEAPVTLQHTLF